jgi:multisubunit Na+/H+ antiporter MnhE subunit
MPRSWRPFLIAWLCLAILWLLPSGNAMGAEIAVGILAAAISAAAFTLVGRVLPLDADPAIAWVRGLWRLPWRVVVDFVTATVALWDRIVLGRDVRGSFATLPFPAEDAPSRSTARRVIATLVLSLPPNSYVIAFDRREGVVIHELVPRRFVLPRLDLLEP